VTVKVAVFSPGVDKSGAPFFQTTLVFAGKSVPSADLIKSRAVKLFGFSPATA